MDELVKKQSFFFRKISCFSLSSRKQMVESTFLTVRDYGDTIYQIAAATTLKPLDAVYHSALYFITGDSFNTHHCILYQKVVRSSLNSCRSLHYSLFVYIALKVNFVSNGLHISSQFMAMVTPLTRLQQPLLLNLWMPSTIVPFTLSQVTVLIHFIVSFIKRLASPHGSPVNHLPVRKALLNKPPTYQTLLLYKRAV